jgi:hypothetical protein
VTTTLDDMTPRKKKPEPSAQEKALYNYNDIEEAYTNLTQNAGKGAMANYVADSAGGIMADFDGLVVSGHRTTTGEAGSDEVVPDAQIAGGLCTDQVTVAIDPDGIGVPTAATRGRDFPALNAGGRMYSQAANKNCTAGFSLKIAAPTYTTTARHCWWHDMKTDGGSEKYGDGVVNSLDGAGRQMSKSGSGGQATPVGVGELRRPVVVGENVLDHEAVDIDQGGLQHAQAQHGHGGRAGWNPHLADTAGMADPPE